MRERDDIGAWPNVLRFVLAFAVAWCAMRLHGIERAIRELRVEVRVINSEVQP
jgi:hypothetical protein